jgi:2-(1,2-epoxy-1,2-dihydrophenyl)acetyl-CoA isomerase
VPASDLDTVSNDLVARLAAAPTVAVGLTKLLVHRGLTAELSSHMADEAWAMEIASRSEDFKEYGQANKEKREPRFSGR